MDYRVTALILAALLLGGCGDEPAPKTAKAPAAKPAASQPAAPAMEEAAMAAPEEEEFTYDPIDVSTLENQWWQQYSSGG